MSYQQIAERCITFVDFALNDKSALECFLKYYKSNYNNFYSKDFESIANISTGRVESFEDYMKQRNSIVDRDKVPFIVYKLLNYLNSFVRIGYSGYSPDKRLSNYIANSRAINAKLDKLTNCHLAIRFIEHVNDIPELFKFYMLWIVSLTL